MIKVKRDEEILPGSCYAAHKKPVDVDPRDIAHFKTLFEDPDDSTETPEEKEPSRFKSASELLEYQKDGGKLTEEDLLAFQESGGRLTAEDIRKFQKQGGEVSAEFLLKYQENGGKLTDSDLHKIQQNGMELTTDDLLKFQENGIKLTGGDIRKFHDNGLDLNTEALHKLQEGGTEMTASDLRAFREAGMEMTSSDILQFQKNGAPLTASDILGFQKDGVQFTEMDLVALSVNGVKFTGGNLVTFAEQGGQLSILGVTLLQASGTEITDEQRDKLVEKGVLPYVSKIPPEATYEEVRGMIESGVDLDIKDIAAHFDAHPEMWDRMGREMALKGLNCRDQGDVICYLGQFGVKMDSNDIADMQEKYGCFTPDDIPWLAEEGIVSFTAEDLVRIAKAGCELSASQLARIGIEVTPQEYTDIVA